MIKVARPGHVHDLSSFIDCSVDFLFWFFVCSYYARCSNQFWYWQVG